MTLSVIVATYNRAALLDECLEHLSRQRFTPGDEVIVVDNGSTDDTAAVVETYRSRFPAALVRLEEPRPGKSHALTLASSIAAGDVLVFTDDDVDVAPEWLDSIRRTMSDPDVALMGGRVSPRWERQPPSWLRLDNAPYGRLTAPLALLNYGPHSVALGERTVLGANMAVRRSALARVGGFATHLGKLRGTLLSGEDADLCRRVQEAGLRAIYAPDACVAHWVPAARMRIGYFAKWFFWSGITNATMDRPSSAYVRSVFGVPRYLVKRLAVSLAASVVAAATGRPDRAVDRIVDVAFVAGYAAQCWRIAGVAVPSGAVGERV